MLKAIQKRMLTISVVVTLLLVCLSASNTASTASYDCVCTDVILEKLGEVKL